MSKKKKVHILNIKYNHKKIRNILLLLNIHTLNSQLTDLRKSDTDYISPSYKFPFDIFVNQQWDVEHIDSQATNRLAKDEDKKNWVDNYKDLCSEDKFKNLDKEINWDDFNNLYKNKNWDECINFIKKIFKEDDEYKDEIGNLTLLNAEINRSYGNHIFIEKKRRVLEEIRDGKYIPHCTQMVFYKNFNTDIISANWNRECKEKYGQYVCEQIKEYLKGASNVEK